jgi:hypothetical protein
VGPWFRDRGRWLAVFSALVLPWLLILFGSHIWAMRQGYSLPRSLAEFQAFGTPLWSYACPSWMHGLGRIFPSTWWASCGLVPKIGECCSYLGVAALVLIAYAAVFRVPFRDTSYWWACLALLVVLSGGTDWTIAGQRVPLPGLWLKKHFPLFQMIRGPARFNLFVGVIAGLVAASGVQHLLARLPGRWMRGAVLAALTVGTIADLAIVPYWKTELPPQPGCYAFMNRTAPGAAFVEVPQFGSSGSDLNSTCAYWQSLHRGRSTVGYCTPPNEVYDNLLTYNSPFFAESLARPEYLEDPEKTPMELGGTAAFREYVWLYMTCHDLRFVVLHQRPDVVDPAIRLDRLKPVLEPAKVFEDGTSVVYDRERLAVPVHPVMTTTRGWRIAQGRSATRVADRQAHLVVYNPDPDRELRLTIEAQSLHRIRKVRLVCEGRELARWEVRQRLYQVVTSPPFHLPGGLHDLVLESDGVSRPRYPSEAVATSDMGPYSLKVDRLEFDASDAVARR